MSTSMREYLLRELGLEETKNLMNVSKFVRSSTKLERDEKCNCCVCKKKSKQMYPNERDTEIIYNHHVMKVEYLAILTDRYHLCFPKNPKAEIGKLKPGDYRFANNFTIYSPRVGVCDKHHTMFHELVGDNDLDIIRQIKLEDAENLVEVFEGFSSDVKAHCTIADRDSDNLKGYKDSYQSIWDETLLKSLTRLSYILKIKELQTNNLDDKENDYYRYEQLLGNIDDILHTTLEYDKERKLKLPDVEVFTEDELMMLEDELCKLTFDSNIDDELDDLFDDDNSFKITDEMYQEGYNKFESDVSGKVSLSLSDIYDIEDLFVSYDEENEDDEIVTLEELSKLICEDDEESDEDLELLDD